MFSLPSFLAFLLPLPTLQDRDAIARRRSLNALDLSPYLRRDIGANDVDIPEHDPRWARRFDLER